MREQALRGCQGVAVGQRRRGPGDFHGGLGQALVHVAPVQLVEGGLDTELFAARQPCQAAQAVEAHDFQFDVAGGQLLAQHRVRADGSPAALRGFRQGQQPVEVALEADPAGQGFLGTPFELQRGHGNAPACVDFAHQIFRRNPDVVEEHLVEFGLAGDLHQRPDGDAGAAHVQQDEAQAPVLDRVRVGTHQHETPVRVLGKAGPDLLAVDHERVTVAHGLATYRSQVRAGSGFRKALAPDFLGAQDGGQETLLLGFAAMGHERRPDQVAANDVQAVRCVGARHLLQEDGVLDRAGAATAILAGPCDARPAAGVQLFLPLQSQGGALVFVTRFEDGTAPTGRQVVVQPLPHLGAQGLFLG